MVKFFEDDFEDATDLDGETEDNATYTPFVTDDTGNPNSGSKNAKAKLSVTWKNAGSFGYEEIATECGGGGEVYASAENVKFSASPDTDEDIRMFAVNETTSGTALCYWGVRNDGGTLKWGIYKRTGGAFSWTYQSSGDAPAANTNYTVKVYLKRADGTGVATLWVDDMSSSIATVSSLDNDDRDLNYLAVGLIFSDAPDGSDMYVYFDDLRISDANDVDPPAAGWSGGDVMGVASGDIGTINGVAIANVGTYNGVTG